MKGPRSNELSHGIADVLIACVIAATCNVAAPAVAGPGSTVTPQPTMTPTATPYCEFQPVPASGPVRTYVTIAGSCWYIHYHRMVSVYFDDTIVAQFDGVASDYSVGFAVPQRARPGPHTLNLTTGYNPFGSITAQFTVTGEAAPCSGDCNLDNRVTVDELITGVNIALDTRPADDCPPFDMDGNAAVAVEELVLAVRAAVRGCDPAGSCRDSVECEPSVRCLAPGAFRGCGFCRTFESDCDRDADCDGDLICFQVKSEDCACEPVQVCQPGCQHDAECEEGRECDDAHRCVRARCSDSSVCPPFFSCQLVTGGGHLCFRRTCDRDSACGNGFCVNGSCYATLGTCSPPVPAPPSPGPSPSPEPAETQFGVCYEQLDCEPLPYATNTSRGFCCGLGGRKTWCAATDIDSSTGLCTHCVHPCQACGNGIREGTEQCDDGNSVSSDGCSADCTLE